MIVFFLVSKIKLFLSTFIHSRIFQAQIFTFLWDNAHYERLERFINNLCEIVKPMNPLLIYLYRENTEATIEYLEKDGGTHELTKWWERDKARPYYQAKPEGAEGFKQFLRDYASFARLLFESIDCGKISVEMSELDWTSYENKILSFLEIKNIPSPEFFPPNGVYKNEKLGYEIIVDGLTIVDPDGNHKKLTSKTADEFYVKCLPIILRFENSDQIGMSGLQINARCSITGMIYKKSRN